MAKGDAGSAASGALTGATMGGMLGGPAGALAGGFLGGVGGYMFGGSEPDPVYGYDPNQGNFQLPGYEDMNSQYGGMIGQGPRSAPQAGQSSFRGGQDRLANMLMAQAQGEGPGQRIAQMQAETQVDRGLGQQLAGARSARPGMNAMAARNAAMASGNLQGAGAQAATMGGLQAQQGAIGSLGSVLGQARGQDQSRAMGNAQLRYQTMGLDDSRQMELLRQRLMMNQMQQQGNQQYEGAQQNRANAIYGYEGQQAMQPSSWDKFMGSVQGAGQGYMQMKAGSAPKPQQQQYGNMTNPYAGLGGPAPRTTGGDGDPYSDENLYGTYTGGQ